MEQHSSELNMRWNYRKKKNRRRRRKWRVLLVVAVVLLMSKVGKFLHHSHEGAVNAHPPSTLPWLERCAYDVIIRVKYKE